MNVFSGMLYNLRGLWLGIRTPKLLALGLIRFVAVLIITIVASSLILIYHQEILNLIWARPENRWVVLAWHVVSWLLSLLLVGLSAVVSFLVSQILFSVWIMDLMSRIAERKLSGRETRAEAVPWLKQFSFLIGQEIPRTIIPVILALLLMILGWLTPLAAVLTVAAPVVTVIFLAWDNTDLIPARRMLPFRARLGMLTRTLPFHLGFGLLFLIPVANILFLSFAPVGAALYHVEKQRL